MQLQAWSEKCGESIQGWPSYVRRDLGIYSRGLAAKTWKRQGADQIEDCPVRSKELEGGSACRRWSCLKGCGELNFWPNSFSPTTYQKYKRSRTNHRTWDRLECRDNLTDAFLSQNETKRSGNDNFNFCSKLSTTYQERPSISWILLYCCVCLPPCLLKLRFRGFIDDRGWIDSMNRGHQRPFVHFPSIDHRPPQEQLYYEPTGYVRT